ncbi:MAG: acyl-CoA dehydrogenase, partial [Acidimicrobiia bacterium]|nr:acyl-CoA dehydrogenase [Acidimicrobiia bacterium]
LGERAYQQAVDYAIERVQGHAIGGAAGPAAIVEHPDVRRMLITMRSYIEAMRGLCLLNAAAIDVATHHGDQQARERSDALAGLLTPVSKAWTTDVGFDLTSLAIQIHGGMGYIEETGVAQHFRDARIAPIYEGTNGIQAMDLVGRKLPLAGGAAIADLLDEMTGLDDDLAAAGEPVAAIRSALAEGVDSVRRSVAFFAAGRDAPLDAFAGATPFLHQLGTVIGGWMHARSALAAIRLLGEQPDGYDREYLEAKLLTAAFYADQILPKAQSFERAACAGAAAMMMPSIDQLRSR